MKLFLTLAVQTLLFFSLVSPSFSEEIEWTGCGIIKKSFMHELSIAFEKKTGIKITITGGGATKGIRSVSAGNTHVGGSCRGHLNTVDGVPVLEEEGAVLVHVAWGALVVIVNPANNVGNISLEQLKDVFDGKITSWKELGGIEKKIALIVRDGKISGVGHMFRQMVFNDPEYEFKARSLKVKSTSPLEQKVERFKTAMAIDGIGSALKRQVKILQVNGVEPRKENIVAGKYPLFRPLYLVKRTGENSPTINKFIDFALSPEGQAVIANEQAVNLREGELLEKLWNNR